MKEDWNRPNVDEYFSQTTYNPRPGILVETKILYAVNNLFGDYVWAKVMTDKGKETFQKIFWKIYRRI